MVIPKEIRRNLRIREGQPLEIYTDSDGGVVFRKHSPIGEISPFTAEYAEAINRVSGIPVAVCDTESIVAVAGVSKKDFLSHRISPAVTNLMENRRSYSPVTPDEEMRVTAGNEGSLSYFVPISAEGSVIGGIMSLRRNYGEMPSETEKKLIATGAAFLSKQLES